jgi:hypothetical protein
MHKLWKSAVFNTYTAASISLVTINILPHYIYPAWQWTTTVAKHIRPPFRILSSLLCPTFKPPKYHISHWYTGFWLIHVFRKAHYIQHLSNTFSDYRTLPTQWLHAFRTILVIIHNFPSLNIPVRKCSLWGENRMSVY